MTRDLRLTFVVESGTDVRLVEGLDRHFQLNLVCRAIPDGFHVNWTPKPLVSMKVGPTKRLAFARFLAHEILSQRPRPDVVVVQGYATASLATNLVARVIGCTAVMLVCSPVEQYYLCRKDAPESGPPFRLREFYGLKALARLNAWAGSNYVVLSEYLRQVVKGHGAREAIEIIPLYGVDVERFYPSHRPRAALRSDLGLPPTGKIILFSSRIAPEKDADTVLRAIGEINAVHERQVWLVNRSGGHESFLRRAAALGVAEHVVAGSPVDPRSELPAFYQAADLCVQASRDEGLGFSALEALACEVPVIATDVGGLRETIIPGLTGWSYPRGDARALTLQVLDVLDHPEEAGERTRRGRELVVERYAERKVFAEFERWVRGAVESRRSARRPESRGDARGRQPDSNE